MTKGQEWWKHPDRRLREQVRDSLRKADAYSHGVMVVFDEVPYEKDQEKEAQEQSAPTEGHLQD